MFAARASAVSHPRVTEEATERGFARARVFVRARLHADRRSRNA
jgi:hypothetical protein